MLNFLKKNLIGLIFGILVICFVIGFYIFAWTEPTSLPPGGNVSVPLNTSLSSQNKAGDLTVVNLNAATFRETGTDYLIDPGGALGQASIKVKNYIQTESYIQAEGGYKSSDGTSGLTEIIKNVVYYQSGYGTCTLTFENGLLTVTTCPTQ